MPRDDWAKARAKDAAKRSSGHNNRSASRSVRRSKERKQAHVTTQRLQSYDTRLWFGKHKDKTVREVLSKDPGYIAFLCRSEPPTNAWRMKALVQFLKQIMSRHSPQNGHPVPATDMREDEALVTSIEGRGKSVARALGTSAEPDFQQMFEAYRCAND